MNYIPLFLLFCIPLRPCDSTIISLDEPNHTQIAVQNIVYRAMNGNSDQRLIDIISHRCERHTQPFIYPDLMGLRELIITNQLNQHNRDALLHYITREIIDSHEQLHEDSIKERHQKYLIAAIGCIATITTAAITAISTWIASRH